MSIGPRKSGRASANTGDVNYMEKVLLSIPEVGAALSLGRSTVYELMARGELPVVHIGRRALIPAQAIRDYADRLVSAAPDAVSA
jgi:excisionase family DNA binding protein